MRMWDDSIGVTALYALGTDDAVHEWHSLYEDIGTILWAEQGLLRRGTQ
jgi:hypothetical protein